MDRKALARKIIDAIFDDAEAEGRVLHRDRVTDIAEKILSAELPNANPWLRPACGASAPVPDTYVLSHEEFARIFWGADAYL